MSMLALMKNEKFCIYNELVDKQTNYREYNHLHIIHLQTVLTSSYKL